jgi:hypothetical protein
VLEWRQAINAVSETRSTWASAIESAALAYHLDEMPSPEHWRKRAHETRAQAAEMNEPWPRATMLEVAALYEVMALRLAKRAVQPWRYGCMPRRLGC